jgi:hypothetical protein
MNMTMLVYLQFRRIASPTHSPKLERLTIYPVVPLKKVHIYIYTHIYLIYKSECVCVCVCVSVCMFKIKSLTDSNQILCSDYSEPGEKHRLYRNLTL